MGWKIAMATTTIGRSAEKVVTPSFVYKFADVRKFCREIVDQSEHGNPTPSVDREETEL